MLVGLACMIVFVFAGWWLALRKPRCESILLILPYFLSDMVPMLSAYCKA